VLQDSSENFENQDLTNFVVRLLQIPNIQHNLGTGLLLHRITETFSSQFEKEL